MGTALRLVKVPGAGRRLPHHVVSVNAATVAADLAAIATHVDGRIQAATASLGLPAAAPALLQPVRLRRDRGASGAALGTLVLDVIGDAVTIGWWQARDAVLALAADRILWWRARRACRPRPRCRPRSRPRSRSSGVIWTRQGWT